MEMKGMKERKEGSEKERMEKRGKMVLLYVNSYILHKKIYI